MRLRNFESDSEEENWQIIQVTKETGEIKDRIVKDQKIEKLLSEIDFSLIDQLLVAECQKSGTDPADEKPISRANFFITKKPNNPAQAEHHPLSRSIELNPENLRQQATDLGISLETWVLFTVFHETVHDYSFTKIQGGKEFYEAGSVGNLIKDLIFFWRKKPENKITRISGYQKTETVIKAENPEEPQNNLTEYRRLHEFFDEGVTDKIALEILKTYQQAKPDTVSKTDLEKLIKVYSSTKEKSGHGRAITLVDKVITDISHETGVGTETVWQAVKRGKMGVENYNDEETQKILQAELPANVYREMTR